MPDKSANAPEDKANFLRDTLLKALNKSINTGGFFFFFAVVYNKSLNYSAHSLVFKGAL